MAHVRVTVSWPEGLHLRPAARLVRLAQSFRSQIRIQLGSRLADARSILHILLLSAAVGTALDIQITGTDEHEATQAVQEFFADQSAGDEAPADAPAQQP